MFFDIDPSKYSLFFLLFGLLLSMNDDTTPTLQNDYTNLTFSLKKDKLVSFCDPVGDLLIVSCDL